MLKSRIPEIIVAIETELATAAEAGAETVAAAARARVPVATGRLRDAIHTERREDGVYVIAGDNEAWYGHIVEHGGRDHPAHPFLVPALEESRGTIIDGFARALKDAI